MIKIIADSSSDLPKEIIEKYNISILPLHIHLGDMEYKDGIDITPEQVFEWSDRNKTTPKTSAISLEDTIQIFRQYKKENDELICFSISSQMSSTCNIMRMAAEEAEMKDKVSVIDSANLSGGIGHLVIEAALMAQEGKCSHEIVSVVEEMKKKLRASFVVDTLTYLHRGGRCNSIEALAGGMLKLHPKIVVEDGKMYASKKYRGKMKNVIMSYVEDMETDLKSARTDRVLIVSTGCEEEYIQQVKNYLEGMNRFQEIIISQAGSVISSHCGPGTLGVLFVEN